jgi:hypothetical protein
MSLSQLLIEELPMNRKERFFTGTLFPMIVCAENFGHFERFLDLIPGCPKLDIEPHPKKANIEFFTEYNLAESIHTPHDKERFHVKVQFRDTPDVMALIRGESSKVLIAVEAKMYDRVMKGALELQMTKQKLNVLDPTCAALSIEADNLFHVALLPNSLQEQWGPLKYANSAGGNLSVITWESLRERFMLQREEDHFLGLLRMALHSYDDLVGKKGWGVNADNKLPGQVIYDGLKKGDLQYKTMGRRFGLLGEHLQEDISSQRWPKQVYEVSSRPEPANKNWFLITDFAHEIEKESSSS